MKTEPIVCSGKATCFISRQALRVSFVRKACSSRMKKFIAWWNLFQDKARLLLTPQCMKSFSPPSHRRKKSQAKMKSWSRSALKSFDRKNAPPLHCFSAGSGSVTRAPRASLIFWSSAVFWVPAKAPNHARFWSISMLPFSRHFALMTIEGLGKKFQEARRARNLTLDEAARMTKIRPARLAEIEADDFSQFPSLAYAKGFRSEEHTSEL